MPRMLLKIFVLALLVLVQRCQLGHAYPPAYANEAPAVGDSGDGDDGDADDANGGYVSMKAPKPKLPPLATYITTSTTSSSSSSSSSPSAAAAGAKTQTGTPMQPAFAYEASIPTHKDQRPEAGHTAAAGNDGSSNTESVDGESTKHIIGSSVVTSVSVYLNGNETEYTDALGHKVPKPQPSLQVASPIDLLNPDRYEFYTFDDNGELVKRLMTMQEIQSIVANGDGEGPSIIHTAPLNDRDPERNVQDIVNSVQSVLNKEVESSKNGSADALPVLDTPDVSSTWSMILPAIFGNTGGDLFLQQKPQQIVMTPDSDVVETATSKKPPTRATKKPKPSKRKPGQKRKTTTSTTTTEMPPQVVQEELGPNETVYTGMQQYQNIASNMQQFEGFSQMHMQPIYHKIPDAVQLETTTRRVFVNNQEMVQTTTVTKPAGTTARPELSESNAKKPSGVHHKHAPPHRNKNPNGQANTTKRPQGTHTKQKVKKKTTTAAPPTTTSTLAPPEPTTTTTTTTTTPAPPPPQPPTSAAPSPSTTTQKKKKKKPTRKPTPSSSSSTTTTGAGHTKPHLAAEKRRPTARPATTQHRPRPRPTQHNHYHSTSSDLTAEASAHHEAAINNHQTHQHQQRPKPHKTTTTPIGTTTTTTTTTTAPPPSAPTSTSPVEETPAYGHHHKHRPHRPASSPTTTTTTTAPEIPEPITTTPAQPQPATTQSAHHQTQQTHQTHQTHHKHRPRPQPQPTSSTEQPSIEEGSLIIEDFPGLPAYPPTTSSTAAPTRTTTRRPSYTGVSGYPVPTYDIHIPQMSLPAGDIGQFKRKPLPALSMLQQQQQHQQELKPVEEDLHTLMSFDQIMQSLQQDDTKQIQKAGEKVQPAKQPAPPMQYGSAETEDKLEEIADKKKKPVKMEVTKTPPPPPSSTYSPRPHYGGSTLATMLADEEGLTGRPFVPSDTSSAEDTTLSTEDKTPVVVITARPQFFATTKQPEETDTESPLRTDEYVQETTEMPDNTPPIRTTMRNEYEYENTMSTTVQPSEEPANVVQYAPVYADIQEPIITDLTTMAPQPTFSYNENIDGITLVNLQDNVEMQTVKEDASTNDSGYQGIPIPKIPVNVPQKIESILADEEDTSEMPPRVVDLKPQLNMEVLKPSEQITMSDFQTQAATVASTLVDGSTNMGADTSMSSNETKTELEFLISDVIQQITNANAYEQPEDTNRLTNFAQLNSSFMLKPPQSLYPEKETTHFNTVYEQTGSTMSVQSTTESIKYESIYDEMATASPTFNQHSNYEQIANKPDLPYEKTQHSHAESAAIPYEGSVKKPESTQYDEIAQKPHPTHKPITELPLTTEGMEQTTLLPSNEDLIKKEEEYLNLVQKQEIVMATTEAPYIYDAETTTFSVPILSLSQIYAHQQQDSEEKQALYETEKQQTTMSVGAISDEASKPTTQTSNEAQATSGSVENVETNKSPENESTEESSTEQSQPNTDNVETTSDSSSTESQYATMINESHNEKGTAYEEDIVTEAIKEETTTSPITEQENTNENYSTMINADEKPLEKVPAETKYDPMINTDTTKKESPEQSYVTMINASDGFTDKEATNTYGKEPTTEPVQSQESEHLGDNVTNGAHLQPQYIADAATEASEISEEKQVEDKTESVEESTEAADATAVVYTASDLVRSSDESSDPSDGTTPRIDVDETSDELTATISDEDETNGSTEEDPYIKLGELTARPVPQKTEDSTSADKSKEEIKIVPVYDEMETTIPTLPQPLQPLELDVTLPAMPAMSYGQQPPEVEDEEDEDDQMGYQPPALVFPSSSSSSSTTTTTTTTTSSTTTTTTPKPTTSTTKRVNTLKPVSYYKQPSLGAYIKPEHPKPITYTASASQQRPMHRPAALNNLMATSTQATRPPVKMEPSPHYSKGLEASTAHLDDDLLAFSRLCNELAFSYWKSITSEKISSARSLVVSPFALTSMLSMVFLGARGSTSGEMNEVLKLDDMVTFNPHLVFRNITDSVERATDSDIATTAFVREIFSDRSNGKILQFFKEKTQQFYAGHVEEVNFHVVNDVIRRRTNLLVKRHTMGKVHEYLRTNSVWVNGPLATISANLFQTDCTRGSTHDRDGEMFFQVHPSVRQRRLVPIPAVLYKSGFTAGYEPKMDATVVAFGRIQDTVSTIYVMPGLQSTISPSDNLDRFEKELAARAFDQNAWSDVLTSLLDRPDMEVQLPRFSHRSFVNASLGLQKMGLKGLFRSDFADLRGLTGSSNRDIYLSDMIQINTFSTCGEDKIADHHHVEMYPAPPLRKRNKDVGASDNDALDSSEAIVDFGSLVQESALGRGFYDDLLDPKYLELPLPLRPRQARVPDAPRLRFDKPFLYFVRHNPTGMILFMGRFNPRLLP